MTREFGRINHSKKEESRTGHFDHESISKNLFCDGSGGTLPVRT